MNPVTTLSYVLIFKAVTLCCADVVHEAVSSVRYMPGSLAGLSF